MNHRTKFSLFFLIAMAIFLFSPQKVLAVNITLSNFPSSISSDPFSIGFIINGPNPGTNYLRVDLYKETTTNYFGETFNGNSWYSGSDGSQYFPITISPEGTASGMIQGRVGSPNLSDYPGPGAYKLRIRRYTGSGNPASGDQQNPIDLQINVTVITPTPTNTPEPTQAPTSTLTPTQTLIPSPTPTKKPAATVTPTKEVVPTDELQSEELLIASSDLSPTPQVLGETSPKRKIDNLLPKILIALGTLLLIISGGLLLLPKLKRYNEKNEEIPKII